MTKRNLTIGIIFLIAILVGGFYLWSQKKTNLNQTNKQKVAVDDKQEQKQQNQQERDKQNQQQTKNDNQEENNQEQKENNSNLTEEKIDTSNWKTYRNEEFGFEMKLPGDLKKWKIYAEELKGDNKYKGTDYTIWFEYPLDKKILSVDNDPSAGYITSMRIWYIEAVPVKNYVDNVCDVNPFPKCRQGEVLGKNSKYVFVSGFYNIQGAGYLCGDMYSVKSDQEKEFCNACEPFSLVDSIDNMIDFKTL